MGTETVADMASCQYDSGDVAWVMMATVLVLGMIPGLAFFESGMLRRKNSVSIITQTLGGLVILACMWVTIGYSLTFSGDIGGMIGNLDHALFADVSFSDCVVVDGVTYSIPTAVFAIFQMMFACVTPLLCTGAVAERMRFKAFLIFMLAFELLVYYPCAHWIWGGGWLDRLGTLDFAGGIVIHVSSGVSSVLMAWMLGPRQDYSLYNNGEFPHSDVRVAVIGAAFLWCGWFGFNGGSAYSANTVAIHSIINTQVGACFSGTIWFVISWVREKPSALALINGAVAGMAGITPACGYISTPSAVGLAIVLGVASYLGTILLRYCKIDDALEVSAIHGLTGAIGALAIGLLSSKHVNSTVENGLFYGGGWHLMGVQCLGVGVVAFYAAAVSGVLLLCIGKCTPLRARAEHEEQGLDHAHHALDVVHLHEEADLNPETPRGLRRIESLDSLNSARRNSLQFGTPVKVDKLRSAALLAGHGSAALLGSSLGSAALLGSSLGTPDSSVHSQWNSHWNSNPSSPAPIPHPTHGHSPNMSTSQSPPIGVPESPPSAMPRLQV